MSFHRTRINGSNLIKQLKELFLEEKKTWLVFQGVDLPREKRVEIGLTYIYGNWSVQL